jgi:NAD(P)-dependent dehydrogenase (short-subunit alcohol dehydrogenase family)
MITGTNEGLSREIARRLGNQGMTVLVGARDPGRSEAVGTEFRQQRIDARQITIDVTDEASIQRAPGSESEPDDAS